MLQIKPQFNPSFYDTDGYTVQIKFDLTVDQTFDQLESGGIFSELSRLLATELGLDASQIVVQSMLPSSSSSRRRRRRRLLSYLLSISRFSFTVAILDVPDVASASSLGTAASSYLIVGTFAVDLGSAMGITVSAVSAVSDTTVLAEAGTDYSCKLNDHMFISWKNYFPEKKVKIALLSDSQTHWISAGVTHKNNPMVATSGHANGVFIYQPAQNKAGYYYLNGYASSDIDLDAQSRVGTEVCLLQSQEGRWEGAGKNSL